VPTSSISLCEAIDTGVVRCLAPTEGASSADRIRIAGMSSSSQKPGPTAAEKFEADYLRARNANVPDGQASEAPATGPGAAADEQEQLDDSVSAEDAAALKAEGNAMFMARDETRALDAYVRALRSAHLTPHDRAVLFGNCAAVHVRKGEWEQVEKEASKALALQPNYGKGLMQRKAACEKLENWSGAARDAKAMKAPAAEIAALEYKAKVKAEKDTAEAIESLKGLGNSFLSNFGLSLDSFQMDKDESGSYSVKMKQ
jgi:tetratricopeptide (TPR) repeat protein